jgi:hypothetical protein
MSHVFPKSHAVRMAGRARNLMKTRHQESVDTKKLDNEQITSQQRVEAFGKHNKKRQISRYGRHWERNLQLCPSHHHQRQAMAWVP